MGLCRFRRAGLDDPPPGFWQIASADDEDRVLDPSHPFFLRFVALAAEVAQRRPVLDLGTSGRFAKEIGLVRHLFDAQGYRAGGYRPDNLGQPDGCDFHCDLEAMPEIASASVGGAICLEVLEHVADPVAAAREIRRILVPGGLLVASMPFLTSYHGKSRETPSNPLVSDGRYSALDGSHATYPDFQRFTHEGLGLLLARAGFSRVDVFPIDGPLALRLEFLRLYAPLRRIPGIAALLARIDALRLGRATTRHFIRAEA